MELSRSEPAVIIAETRSGSTFLTHCLSNHPDIFCHRGEPMHGKSVWGKHKLIGDDLLYCLLHQQFYTISMCELTRHQAFYRFWEYLTRTQPKVILLSRKNVIRQCVEILLAKLNKQGKIQQPRHTVGISPEVRVSLAAETILEGARKYVVGAVAAHERCQAFDNLLEITYADIVGREIADVMSIAAPASERICSFLGVPALMMSCRLRATNPHPLRKILLNWDEVEEAVAQSELAYCLEDEYL